MHEFKYAVSLRFFSKTVDLADVCSQLNLSPKWLNKMGELRVSPKGTPLGGVYDCSYCSVSLEPHEAEELHETLERVAVGLVQYKNVFQAIKRDGGRAEFFIGWYSTGNTGDTFDCELLKRLGELEIDLAFDVYGESAG
ncbi:DUF4279 domain-containing protein [Ralstonia pseudosolanacearum]|uniref:DUF4279 domain-containing protein n=1 Tax=Ralstonia solanacearum TaxID=305 RepID=A0AA92E9V1_RALSL|nr:DUF4279 domain-containing protein [Ralstonia pseudosolanacearum]QCX47907.1 DUF4279 domain-containing protein [Ralstonia pseudosolanacearum]QCX51433.1 DUF4279 domain-containing protein [Ralstonia pseudosolanacearum]